MLINFYFFVLKFVKFALCLLIFAGISFNSSCRQTVEEKPLPISKVATLYGAAEKIGEPFGVAVKADEIYVSDGETGSIYKISKSGVATVLTDKLNTPSQIAFDKNGDLIVADSGSHTIKKIKPSGEVELVAGVENQSGFADGEAKSALFNAPIGVAIYEETIYVADTYNDRIRIIEKDGVVGTIAGSSQGFADGDSRQAKFDTPTGLTVLPGGTLLVADTNNRRLRVVGDGSVRTLLGNGTNDIADGSLAEAQIIHPTAVAVEKSGAIYFTDGNAVRVIENFVFPMVKTISGTRRGFADGDLKASRFNRPSGLAFDETGNLFVADSENQALRVFTGAEIGKTLSPEEIENSRVKPAEFRKLAAARWSYDPPEARREIAGTLGEVRGEVIDDDQVWFHNGLDIVGGYGETARLIRTEKILRPVSAENFATLRELVRFPTLGYIHLRIGRDKDNKLFDDRRFIFSRDETGKLDGVRVPRGARFQAGEALGTLNAMNHVHLIAGRSGAEMNALDALELPAATDKIAPVIENISLFNENWQAIETQTTAARITISGKTRIVAKAYDRMDGNAERRRLGVFQIGYQILKDDRTPVTDQIWSIRFDRLPEPESIRLVYARGSKSGATGETVFNYIATNKVHGNVATEDFFDAAQLANGAYVIRVFAADYFGNTASKDLEITVNK